MFHGVHTRCCTPAVMFSSVLFFGSFINLRFYYQWFRQRADETCWPSVGHSWSQTCHFGPRHPSSWRNTPHTMLQHVTNVTNGSHFAAGWIEASSRSTMENMAAASHRGSGLWHWRDLVVLQPSLVRRSSEWVSSSIDCISPSRNAPTEAWRAALWR